MERILVEGSKLPCEVNAGECACCGNLPTALRVLVVDDDQAYSNVLCAQLCSLRFLVALTTDLSQDEGFSYFGKNSHEFDLVFASMDMPMGIEFIEFVTENLDLPIIGMFTVIDIHVIRVRERGVCVVLKKPLEKVDLGIIWLHVHRTRKGEPRRSETNMARTPPHQGNLVREYRLVWTRELDSQFRETVHLLGVENATPTKVLEHMNQPRLGKKHIYRRLQKYLLLMKNKAVAKSDPKDRKNTGGASPNTLPGITINELTQPNMEDTTQRLEPLQIPNLPAPKLLLRDMNMQPSLQGAQGSDVAMQQEHVHDQSRVGRQGESTDGTLSLSKSMIADSGLDLSNQLQEKGLRPESPVPSYGAGQSEMETEVLPCDE